MVLLEILCFRCAASSCTGSALRIEAGQEAAALRFFDERELVCGAYIRRAVTLTAGEEELSSHAYVADATHQQYCGDLSDERAAELVAAGVGTRGTALDYLKNTLGELREAGVSEPRLERVLIAATVRAGLARGVSYGF